jgi:hypothetical protein
VVGPIGATRVTRPVIRHCLGENASDRLLMWATGPGCDTLRDDSEERSSTVAYASVRGRAQPARSHTFGGAPA